MQKRTLQRILTGAVAGMFTMAMATPAAAAGPQREGAQAQPKIQPNLTTVLKQKIVSTSMQGDSARIALAAGFSNIGTPINFSCAKACTVVVQTMVQVEELSPYWAICPNVDGVDAVQGCNWQGISSSSSSVYATGNGTYFWSLAAGAHVLQPKIYLSVAGALNNWGLTLGVYKTP